MGGRAGGRAGIDPYCSFNIDVLLHPIASVTLLILYDKLTVVLGKGLHGLIHMNMSVITVHRHDNRGLRRCCDLLQRLWDSVAI